MHINVKQTCWELVLKLVNMYLEGSTCSPHMPAASNATHNAVYFELDCFRLNEQHHQLTRRACVHDLRIRPDQADCGRLHT